VTAVSKFTDYLNKNTELLAVEIVDAVLDKMKLEIPEWEKEQAIKMYIEFIGFLAGRLNGNEGIASEDLILWSRGNGERAASSGERISEIIVRYPPTRMILTEMMIQLAVKYTLSVKEISLVINEMNLMLDISINETIFAFERRNDKILQDTQREMEKLSAPIVPIRDGIAILPLIGKIDFYRAEYLSQNVVPKIAELDIDYLIVDFSGILDIDLEIAQYLYNIESVLRLIGIQTIVTGLRPSLAQTVVRGGIDMSNIKTFAHLKQALESIK
jgi:rsbT co-antagonist protein RsbR